MTEVRERPRTAPADVPGLFYTEVEISRFEDDFCAEEARGLEIGTLGEQNAFSIENIDADGMETYDDDDFDDDSFDKGGFGDSDDMF